MRLLALAGILLAAVALAGCANPDDQPPLAEYGRYAGSPRLIDPGQYIAYLKQTRFTHGELDDLPTGAIIYHGDPLPMLYRLGYTDAAIGPPIELGTTDPETLYVVQPNKDTAFMVERGLPGAGGIATEAAELYGLGARDIVHIGTCCALGQSLPTNYAFTISHGLQNGDLVLFERAGGRIPSAEDVIVALGAYRDGAAVMLAKDSTDRISSPAGLLSIACAASLAQQGIPAFGAVGYTIPIYYGQPSGLLVDLLQSDAFSSPRPAYIEMEEASFFESGRRFGFVTASLTVPSDRYWLEQGKLHHEYLDDAATDKSLSNALAAAIEAVTSMTRGSFSKSPATNHAS